MTKLIKSFVVVISLLLATSQISCNSDGNSNSDCEDVVCTAEFVTIEVFITDQNQNPVALDSFEVINIENGNDMTISLSSSEYSIAQQHGQYPLVDDGSIDVNQERQIQFKGFINNKEIINSSYAVSKDCCHIDVAAGDLQLTTILN